MESLKPFSAKKSQRKSHFRQRGKIIPIRWNLKAGVENLSGIPLRKYSTGWKTKLRLNHWECGQKIAFMELSFSALLLNYLYRSFDMSLRKSNIDPQNSSKKACRIWHLQSISWKMGLNSIFSLILTRLIAWL